MLSLRLVGVGVSETLLTATVQVRLSDPVAQDADKRSRQEKQSIQDTLPMRILQTPRPSVEPRNRKSEKMPFLRPKNRLLGGPLGPI